jgi:hypothetical protein
LQAPARLPELPRARALPASALRKPRLLPGLLRPSFEECDWDSKTSALFLPEKNFVGLMKSESSPKKVAMRAPCVLHSDGKLAFSGTRRLPCGCARRTIPCSLRRSGHCGLSLGWQRVHKEQMRIAERIYYAFIIAFLCNLAEGLRWDLLPETRYRTSVRREGAWREAG